MGFSTKIGTPNLSACSITEECVDVVDAMTMPSPDGKYQEAVCVMLEHKSEPPVICYLPFNHGKGKVDYGEIFAKRGELGQGPLD